MRRAWGVAACAALVLAVAAAPAQAGTYDVVSCGAPGANGVNRAWTVQPGSVAASWDWTATCPLSVTSEPRAGILADSWSGAGFQLDAPPGARLERLQISRYGYEFASAGTEGSPWVVQGYNGDATVIGGPLFGETCGPLRTESGVTLCDFGYPAPMSDASRADRSLNTTRVSYQAACYRESGAQCATANAAGFPYAGFSIYGSVATVREDNPPVVAPGGALLGGGWRTADDPLEAGAADPVGVRRVRVLVDGAEARVLDQPCDATRMVPCPASVRPALTLNLPDGAHTVSVEATDSAGNVAGADRQVLMDRNPPALAFAPSRGTGRTVIVDASDPGSGVAAGAIAVRRGRSFRALPTRVSGGRLIAHLKRGSRRGRTFRATATDNLGRTSTIVGAPVRLRAGFGPHMRKATRGSLSRARTVRGRLSRPGGKPLAGQPITITQTVQVDGAAPQVAAVVRTGRDGGFRAALPPGPSRRVAVTSAGDGGLQAGLRHLSLRVRWSSTLHLSPRAVPRGGRVRISGRLRLGGARLPASGKLVELLAYDRGQWRLFSSTRAGASGRWATSYRFTRGRGTYRMRARMRRDGRVPFVLGYSPVRSVRVG